MTIASLYTLLVDPNVAFLLFIIAIMGIYLEVVHPGTTLFGLIGASALLFFFIAAAALSPNWAGFVCMSLSFVFLVLDIKLLGHGLLTLGAMALLILGTFIFFNNGHPAGPALNPWLVYAVAAVIGLIGFTLVGVVARSHRSTILNGVEGMVGATVVALTPLRPQGSVKYAGEIWNAVLEPTDQVADEGSRLKIVSVEGLRLHVQPVQLQRYTAAGTFPE